MVMTVALEWPSRAAISTGDQPASKSHDAREALQYLKLRLTPV
jgi:hypothetical protein